MTSSDSAASPVKMRTFGLLTIHLPDEEYRSLGIRAGARWWRKRRPGWRLFACGIRPGHQIADSRLIRPIFPGPPGFRRIGAVAAIARVDLSLRKILDRAAQLLGPQKRARIARQKNRHAHNFDEQTSGRRETMTPHQRHVCRAEALRQIPGLLDVCDQQIGIAE